MRLLENLLVKCLSEWWPVFVVKVTLAPGSVLAAYSDGVRPGGQWGSGPEGWGGKTHGRCLACPKGIPIGKDC